MKCMLAINKFQVSDRVPVFDTEILDSIVLFILQLSL